METCFEIVYNSSMCLEKRNFDLTIELNQIEDEKIEQLHWRNSDGKSSPSNLSRKSKPS